VPYGGTKVVRFHVPEGPFTGNGGTIINEQTSHSNQQFGDFHVTITGSYGRPYRPGGAL
jgi:hypothetical protein